MEKYTLTFDKYELNTLFRGLKMMEAKCLRIENMLEKDFTEEFHVGWAGHMSKKGIQLFDENMNIKLRVGRLINKLQDIAAS